MSQAPSSSTITNSVSIDPVTGKKHYNVGTLTYTSGAVVGLFIILLLGDFAWSMRDRSIGQMSQWYLTSLKIPNFWYGILFSTFPAMVGLILGPIISVKSDRHRGRWGRRIPFLLITTPIAAMGMIGLGMTPIFTKWLHHSVSAHGFIYQTIQSLFSVSFSERLLDLLQNEIMIAMICFGVFWAAFELATIAGQHVFGGLINDVVPRPLIGRFYGFFRAISLIDGMIFNKLIYGHVDHHFTLIMVLIGLFYGSAFMWVCFKIREGEYPPPPPLSPNKLTFVQSSKISITGYFKECFSNPYYVLVFFMIMTAALSFLPINLYAVPYSRSLGISSQKYGDMLFLTYTISLTLSFFLGYLADKFHPIRMGMLTLFGYFCVTLWGHFNALDSTSFIVAWILHGVLSGCYFTSTASITQRLFPHSKFAQFASAAGILASLGNMIVGPAVGSLIDATGKVYRYAFTVGCGITVLAFIATLIVYFRFLKLGGDKNYVAPGEGEVIH